MACDPDPGAGRHLKTKVLKHRPLVLVLKRDVSKLDGSQRARQRPSIRALKHPWGFIEKKKGALSAGKMSLEATDFPSNDFQWFVQLPEVGHHQKQVAESQRVSLDVTYAYPYYCRCPQCRGQTDQETIAALR